MAKFLNASATAYHLEQLIKEARTRLILISPELKLSGRTKELLEEKSGIEAAIVYGQNDLPPEEVNWLRGLASGPDQLLPKPAREMLLERGVLHRDEPEPLRFQPSGEPRNGRAHRSRRG